MFLLNGQPLSPDAPFIHDEVQYPANWLRLSTAEEKEAIGITEVVDHPRPDDRYYWVTANPDGTFTSTPKDLTQLKDNAVSQIDAAAHSLLLPSDYMVVKAVETGEVMDPVWKTWRAQIRSEAKAAKASIAASVDIQSLTESVNVTWTLDPVNAALVIQQPTK